MRVSYVLIDIAKAQANLLRLAQQMLREDKGDGVRWTNWMDKHDTLLRQMVDDARGHSDLTDEEELAITETAAGR